MNRLQFTVGILGSAPDDAKLLPSMLKVIGSMTHAEWRMAEPGIADVVIYKSENPADLRLAPPRGNNLPLLVLGTDAAIPAGYEPVCTPLPLRVMSLLASLDAASARLSVLKVVASPRASQALIAPSESLVSNSLTLIEALRRIRATAGPWLIDAPQGRLKVYPRMLKASVVGFDDSSPMAQLEPTTLVTLQDGSDTTDDPSSTQRRWIELDLLFWAIGTRSGSLGLSADIARGQTLRLRRFPDFGRFGSQTAFMRAATVLTSMSLTSDALMTRARLTPELAAGFLNACSLCGYLETVSSPAPMPAAGRAGTTAPKAKQKSGLFARLRERLGLQVG